MPDAPIALFVYKRPEHTRKVLESLIKNIGFSQSRLYVFCDGPKQEKDVADVRETRKVIRSYSLSNAVLVEREQNLGLANSIIDGVTWLCHECGRIIVLEDDLITSPYFLDYMNKALNCYKDEQRVMQISGYMFPITLEALADAVFLPFSTTWGWATWQRAWSHFDPTAAAYAQLKNNKPLRKRFDLDGSYPYFLLLRRAVKGRVDSWGIRWYLSVFLRGGLTLFPVRTLIQNIGFDRTGSHSQWYLPTWLQHRNQLLASPIARLPRDISVNDVYYNIVKDSIRSPKWLQWLTRT